MGIDDRLQKIAVPCMKTLSDLASQVYISLIHAMLYDNERQSQILRPNTTFRSTATSPMTGPAGKRKGLCFPSATTDAQPLSPKTAVIPPFAAR